MFFIIFQPESANGVRDVREFVVVEKLPLPVATSDDPDGATSDHRFLNHVLPVFSFPECGSGKKPALFLCFEHAADPEAQGGKSHRDASLAAQVQGLHERAFEDAE